MAFVEYRTILERVSVYDFWKHILFPTVW